MSTVSPGFRGRRRRPSAELPPGQLATTATATLARATLPGRLMWREQ
jgi:hypothetical protein